MTLDELVAEIEKCHRNATNMYIKHIRSCDICISGAKCAYETKCIDIIENIDPIHYKYACNG